MSHAEYHSKSSAKKYGGEPSDYLEIHQWFDESKDHVPLVTHRSLRHHTLGILDMERHFGMKQRIEELEEQLEAVHPHNHLLQKPLSTMLKRRSDGKEVPLSLIGEQHCLEDFGGKIPSVQDWLNEMRLAPWMAARAVVLSRQFEEEE